MLKMINEALGPFFRWILWGVWDERVTPILILLGISIVVPAILLPLIKKYGKNKNKK